MGAASEFDIGPLTWVKGEIEQALARAGEALAAYLANPRDSAQLKICKTHLHQAHGALEIVGLEGVTRLTEQAEHLIDLVDTGQRAADASVGLVLSGAFGALAEYLNELVEGAPHQPVRLFPAYRAVMQASGAERVVESELFFPDLAVRPPKREVQDLPADLRAYVLGQRRRFQAGLLRWLRNEADNAALREMTDAVRAIERTQALPQHRSFWWVTIGFIESLVALGARSGLDAKRLCARIDLQMKRLMEGSQNVAERLLRDTLYFVARSRVQSPQLLEIRRLYALDNALPPEETPERDTRPQEANLRAVREILAVARDKWNRFSSGHAHELSGFRDQAAQLRDRVAALGNHDLALLVHAISSVTVWVAENPGRVTESIALETATALLLAENATENFTHLTSEFPQQVMAMGARLKASLVGETANVPAVPLLDEMSRRAQERLLMAQVVIEIKSNLSAIEAALDGFFRDAGRRGDLPALDGQVRQVLGALSILGADRAVAALTVCQSEIARFASPEYVPVQGDFEQVAQTMSGLGFFIEALQHGPADFDALMQPIVPRHAVPVPVEDLPTQEFPAPGVESPRAAENLTVEEELAQEQRDARTLFEAWRDKPGDAMLAAELKANIAAIEQDADLVDQPRLQESAARMLELLEQPSVSAAGIVHLEQTMAQVAPEQVQEPTPPPSEEVKALARSSDEVVDAELLSIFLEEAHEMLGNVLGLHAQVETEPTRKDLLTTIRRGFHTLKGSGRMVGLARFGDAAWAVEQTMNQWLQDARPASADLLALIGAAHALFSRWVADLSDTGGSSADGEALIAAATRMRAGEPLGLAVAPVVAPPVVDFAFGEEPTEEAPFDQSVVIGGVRVSKSLYNIFVEEAAIHLSTMRNGLALMAAEPQPPRDELVRAAHTLAGIAGTVSFTRLHELGRAFERLLLVGRSGSLVPDVPELALLGRAADALGAMVAAVVALQPPAPTDDLEILLDAKRAEWLATSGELEPALSSFDVPGAELAPPEPDAQATPAHGTALPVAGSVPPAGAAEVDFDFSEPEAAPVEAPVVTAQFGAGTAFTTDATDVAYPVDDSAGAAAEAVDFDFSEPDEAPVEAPVVTAQFGAGTALTTDATDVAPKADDSAGAAGDVVDIDFSEPDAGPADAPTGTVAPGAGTTLTLDAADPAPVFEAAQATPVEPVALPSGSAIDGSATPTALNVAEPSADRPFGSREDHEAPDARHAARGDAGAPPAPAAVADAPAQAADWATKALAAGMPQAGVPTQPAAPGAESLPSKELLRARGFDPAERMLHRIADEIDPQLLPIFMEEAAELMPWLGELLRAWSGDASAKTPAQGMQRVLHTLKGSARMAGAMAVGQLAHSMETRIENAHGLPLVPSDILDGLMSSYDRINFLLDQLREYDPARKLAHAAATVAVLEDDMAPDAPATVTAVAAVRPATPTGEQAPAPAPAAAADEPRAVLRVRADVVDRLVNEAGEVAIARSRVEGEMRAVKTSLKDLTENVVRLRNQLREIEIAAETQMQSRQREADEKLASFDPLEFDRFTRFQEVTRMMAESVNDVATVQQQLLKSLDDADAALLAQARMTRDLQNDLMRVRMVPFNNVAERLYRVVRQTAKELGKRANLDIRGMQTEIDRSVLERMTGPFEHLLRNAIAHGLEDGAGRSAADKHEIGQIQISARQAGNEFVLVFEDDGRGLDLARIRAHALAVGLARESDTLSDAQVAEFIFAPGFSTAREVTPIAGRGIGMDVVRAEVAALGGRIDTEFTPGRGTRFTIFLPLTLAVTHVVLVRAGQGMFAVPSVMVEQVRQVRAADLATAYEARAYEWQGRAYPLFYLPRLLGELSQAASSQRFTPVLLLRSGTQRAAIHVDQMIGNQEVVVKNIGPQLARVTGIAGATVLGNGQIVLILNPVPMALQSAAGGADHAQTASDGQRVDAAPVTLVPGATGLPVSTLPTVMVVDDSLTVRKITSRLLSRENYQVVVAKDGIDALEQMQALRPDIMLVDIEMPRMDGFDLTRNVRADPATRHIPIIMISSRTADKHRKLATELGVNAFLGKPYQEDELLRNITRLLKPAEALA